MILLILVFLLAQESRVITCVINSDKTVSCPEPIPAIDESWVKEWELVAPMENDGVNSDAPLYSVPLTSGQRVKVVIDGDRFTPVATCQVRVWRKLKDYTSNHPGDRVPLILRTEPDDCQPEYGKD